MGTTTDQQPEGFKGPVRWRVSTGGQSGHLRVAENRTLCGETISMTGGPVGASANLPPCERCNRAAGVKPGLKLNRPAQG